jgi:hypothetical protein
MAIPDSTIKSVQNLINSWDQYVDTLKYGKEKGTRTASGGKAALQQWFDSFIKPNGGGTDTQPTVTFPAPYVNKTVWLGSYGAPRPSNQYSQYQDAWMNAYTKIRIFLLAVAPVGAVQQLDTIYSKYTKTTIGK